MLGPGADCEMENRSANYPLLTQWWVLTARMCISGSTTFPPPIESSESMPNSPICFMTSTISSG